MGQLRNPHPGKILKEDFLNELNEIGLSQNQLAHAIDVPGNCIHAIVNGSYVPLTENSLLSGDFLLGLLNSQLLDWYFRLGSTNSKVNEYQFNNLVCPVFRSNASREEQGLLSEAMAAMASDPAAVPRLLSTLTEQGPFSPVVRSALEGLARKIQEYEGSRATITRQERSSLWDQAQPYQDALDVLLFKIAGLTDLEIDELRSRLDQML